MTVIFFLLYFFIFLFVRGITIINNITSPSGFINNTIQAFVEPQASNLEIYLK